MDLLSHTIPSLIIINGLSSANGSPLDNKGVYKAAADDISPDLSTGLCNDSNSDPSFQYDMSKWYFRLYPASRF